MYRSEQVDAYREARDLLERRGVDVDELAEGDVLATLSRDYVEAVGQPDRSDTPETQGGRRELLGALSMFAPVAVFLFLLVGVAFAAAFLLL